MHSDHLPTATCQNPIALLYFNAGGGHRAAAQALKIELQRQQPDYAVVLVDLFAVLDAQQRFKRLTGFAPESYYNKRLSTGFTLGLKQELKVLQAMIRLAHPKLVRRLVQYWLALKPSMVVSLVPNFNRAIGASVAKCYPDRPFVTVMTDLADYPPHFWVEPNHTEYLICGTAHAYAQAVAQGVNPQRIHRVSGMVLSPRFYQSPTESSPLDRSARRTRCTRRKREREALGFAPDQAVGCVMFGGHGSAAMRQIALSLSDRPLILMCGHNEPLKRRLQRLTSKAPHVVVGFTDDVAHWMRLADYFIGKPGPGSISEAVHCGLPVIVTRNAWTMPQERFNTDWVRDQQLGHVVATWAQVRGAVQTVITDLALLQHRVAQVNNNAAFEIAALLGQVAHRHTKGPGDDGLRRIECSERIAPVGIASV